MKEFGRQVAMREISTGNLKGYAGNKYDYTSMRTIFKSQNLNKAIASQNTFSKDNTLTFSPSEMMPKQSNKPVSCEDSNSQKSHVSPEPSSPGLHKRKKLRTSPQPEKLPLKPKVENGHAVQQLVFEIKKEENVMEEEEE